MNEHNLVPFAKLGSAGKLGIRPWGHSAFTSPFSHSTGFPDHSVGLMTIMSNNKDSVKPKQISGSYLKGLLRGSLRSVTSFSHNWYTMASL